jgi:hypothetical protein
MIQQQQLQPQGAVPYAVPVQAAYMQQGPAQSPFAAPVYNGASGYAAPPQQFPQPNYAAATPAPMPQQQPQEGDFGQEGQTAQQPYSYHPTNNFVAPPGGCGLGNTGPLPPSASVEGTVASLVVGSCVRCSHIAPSAEDRFCSACGGSIRRTF